MVPTPPPYGGVTNWSTMIIGELGRRGVEFDLVDTSPRQHSIDRRTFYQRFIVGGFNILKVRRQLALSIRAGAEVAHIATSGRFAAIRDIVLMRYARRHGLRTVYHLHFGYLPEIQRRNTWEWRLLRCAIRLASLTIAIDRSTLNALSTVADPGRLAYVPNPIDVAAVPTAGTAEQKSILFLGWIIERKGIRELLEAWGQFHERNPDWSLQIVGPIGEREYFRRLEASYSFEGVRLYGERGHAEAMRMLSECGVFVLPAHSEGFPYALLEAMAMGKAAIATRVGAIPDMLADECGLLIDPYSPEDILEALEEFAGNSDRRASCGNNARDKVLSEYDLGVVFPQYVRHWGSDIEPGPRYSH